MIPALRLFRADLRNVGRDPMLVLLVAVPVGTALLARAAFPILAAAGEARGADVAPYADLVTAFLLLLAPMMLGFVTGFLLLDERDEHVLTAIAVTPVGRAGFFAYRTALPVALSLVLGCVVAYTAGLSAVDPARLAPAVVLAALEAPLLALFLVAFAGNKVEGMALAKVGSVLIGLALIAPFVPEPWLWAAGVIPQFWPVWLFLHPDAGGDRVALLALAFVVHAAALWLLLRVAVRRTS